MFRIAILGLIVVVTRVPMMSNTHPIKCAVILTWDGFTETMQDVSPILTFISAKEGTVLMPINFARESTSARRIMSREVIGGTVRRPSLILSIWW